MCSNKVVYERFLVVTNIHDKMKSKETQTQRRHANRESVSQRPNITYMVGRLVLLEKRARPLLICMNLLVCPRCVAYLCVQVLLKIVFVVVESIISIISHAPS